MAPLFGIIAVVLTIAIIFGRRVARWVVILGLFTIMLIAAGFFGYVWWSDWSSGRMELNSIISNLVEEQMKYNLSRNEEVPQWRGEEVPNEIQTGVPNGHIYRLAADQVPRVKEY